MSTLILKRVTAGNFLPRFYGIAWTELWRQEAVCAPIPLCFVIRLCHWIYWGLAARWLPADRLEQRLYKRLHGLEREALIASRISEHAS